ncbi:exopolyphosphatase [Cryptosporangium phraense]|uniref:Exopolyphosphatase n=1 Tax=Cryptosporangium phraense TaxID=2593070 RepID=A0A545ATR0_9ACTN|nr:exopolyphosphatase [Cryptosporangium phraense]TQS44717.1 exopolyphosphatase [Cryptosporangium phraense]
MTYRLVTRSDFDGLVCAVLLRSLDLVDEIVFVHPKPVQDGLLEITDRDILTNPPYSPRAHLVFDHHHSEALRVGTSASNYVLRPDAPSAARVVYDYFGGAARFPKISDEMMRAVDAGDSGAYDITEILYPQGWTLLNFLMDSRTGLGRFRHFRISNYQLMMRLISLCAESPSAADILAQPDVAERVEVYRKQANAFTDQLRRVGRMVDDVVVVDFRGEQVIHAGNRFMVYALFPHARISIHVLPGRGGLNTVLAVGKSILDRSSPTDIGAVMLRHGGGGHRNAGSCQTDNEHADDVLARVVREVADPARVTT